MSTTTKTMTTDEFAAYAANGRRCELIRGEVFDMSPTGGRHGKVTMRLAHLIALHVYERNLGEVFAAETGFRLDDNGKPTVRAPDIAFIAKARLAAADTPKFIPIAPDLAVETLSPDDRATYVSEKVQWWLNHGVRLVWVVDADNETITVHHPGGRSSRLAREDVLAGGDMLPGFELRLADLFR